jgi:arylsulfatase A-like enzyme
MMRRAPGLAAIAAAIVTATGVVACRRDRLPVPRALVLITLDTTRADRLPFDGTSDVATPALDHLARDAVVFTRASSVAPLTLTAHTSLLTGLYPPHHGVRDNADLPLDGATPTLATLLHERHFRTAAFVGAAVLARDRGLARGFDVYDDGRGASGVPARRRPAGEVIDQALAWTADCGQSQFFLWVHLYDAHAPQTLPREYRVRYGDRYDGAAAYMDAEIGRLLAGLDRAGRLTSAAVIVAGDHGESLGEHGEAEHGLFLYEGAVHVPLLIRVPGARPRRAEDVVSLVDIVPTVLDAFRLSPMEADGVNLLRVLRGQSVPERLVYGESMYAQRFGWHPLRMTRDARFKYIDAPRPELYDLVADPFELRDLSAEQPARLVAMRAKLEAIDRPRGGARDPAAANTADRRALGALGYVSGAVAMRPLTGLDPKDFVQVYNNARRHGAPE